MDDQDGVEPQDDSDAGSRTRTVAAAKFGGPVDGFDDNYLPDVEDEYGPPMSLAANEITQGDLVDVSIDGVSDWKYVPRCSRIPPTMSMVMTGS